MACFEGLPLELRREIYSYLLVDHNVVDLNSITGILEPRYSVSLFRVSQKISQEAMLYFYTKNAFILVDWSSEWDRRINQYHKCCIMKKIQMIQHAHKTKRFELKRLTDERVVLSIRLTYTDWDSPIRTSGNVSVVSTTQLEKLVKLLNARHWERLRVAMDSEVEISLKFSEPTSYFTGNRFLKDRIINSIRLFKGPRINFRPLPFPGPSKISFHISGEISGEQARAIENQSQQPLLSADLLQYSRDFLRLAQDLFNNGSLIEARGAYDAAFTILDHTTDRDFDDAEAHERYHTKLELHIQMSHIYSKLKQTKNAVRAAHAGFELWGLSSYYLRGNYMNLMSKEQLDHRLTKALTDDGLLGSIATVYESIRESWTREGTYRNSDEDTVKLDCMATNLWPEEHDDWVRPLTTDMSRDGWWSHRRQI